MQQQPNTYQPNTNFNGNQSFGGGNQNDQKKPYRTRENDRCCSTHGCHIHDDHHSGNCTEPGAQHNPRATRNNRMGGSNSGEHRTIMPSQSGRQADHRPMPLPSRGRRNNQQPQYQQPQYQQANMMGGSP